jgi:hypothetical protein
MKDSWMTDGPALIGREDNLGPMVLTVVSGGQTGVDRAALDAAMAAGLPCGGWCPRGRRAEDGTVPARYPLQETATRSYPERTERNIRDSDATLVLHAGALRGGTALTVRLCRAAGRPLLRLDPRTGDAAAVADWIRAHGVRRLNVAGPRESEQPGIGAAARALLLATFALLR